MSADTTKTKIKSRFQPFIFLGINMEIPKAAIQTNINVKTGYIYIFFCAKLMKKIEMTLWPELISIFLYVKIC